MNLLDTARQLAELGYHVFPVTVGWHDGRKILAFPGGSWPSVASRSVSAVQEMPWADATNIGIATEPSGVVVIDLDAYVDEVYEEGVVREIVGLELFEKYQNEIAGEDDRDDDAPAMPSTSGKGFHIYYQADPEQPLSNSQKRLAPWVDLRGEGGMVILGQADEEFLARPVEDLPRAPGWLVEAAATPEQETPKADPREPRYGPEDNGTKYGLRALTGELRRVNDAWDRDAGDFNGILNLAAFAVGQLVAGGELDENHAHGALDAKLTELGAPSDQWKTLDSGFWSGYARPRSASDLNEDERVTDEALRALEDEFLDEAGMKSLPPPTWLIDGWIERNSFVHLVGAAGEGKSFVMLDMAECLGTGRSWPEHKPAARGPQTVWYVVAEAAHGVGPRLVAWEEKWGPGANVRYLPRAIQIAKKESRDVLMTSGEWKAFAALAKERKPAMIVFDTQARVTVGVEENSATEMGQLVRILERLQRETEAAVVLVHHTGKSGETARGSSALIGAISTEIKVKKRKDVVTVSNTKQKNAEQAKAVRFTMTEVAESVVLLPRGLAPPDHFGGSPRRQQVRGILRDATEPLSVGDVAKAAGLDRRGVRDILNWMVAEGYASQQDGLRGGNSATLYLWAPNPTPGGS